MYKKIALLTTISLGLTGPLLASDEEGDNRPQIRKFEITPDFLGFALEKATLGDDGLQNPLPTFQEYCTQNHAAYALALKDYMDLVDRNQERQVGEILRPRTEVYLPCAGGLLVYKFLGVTAQKNLGLHREIIDIFLGLKKAGITFHTFDPDFAKGVITAAFIQKHLPKLKEGYELIHACKEALTLPGVEVEDSGGSKLLLFREGVSEEVQSLAINAVTYLSQAPDLDFSPEVEKSFFESLTKPVFVEAEISENDTFGVTNIRGVTLN